jgi:hypothetical protein
LRLALPDEGLGIGGLAGALDEVSDVCAGQKNDSGAEPFFHAPAVFNLVVQPRSPFPNSPGDDQWRCWRRNRTGSLEEYLEATESRQAGPPESRAHPKQWMRKCAKYENIYLDGLQALLCPCRVGGR